MKKVKRFMTRIIGKTYHIFKENDPQINLGKLKFYSLRPKWLLIHPLKEVCVCIYCANFDICLIRKKLLSLVVCPPPTNECKLDECKNCPGASSITIEFLDLSHKYFLEEVTFAFWNKDELKKNDYPCCICRRDCRFYFES